MNATITNTATATTETALSLSREALTAEAAATLITVVPDAAWLRVRELLGDSYHASYVYKLTNVDGVLFLATWTERTDKKGKTSGKFVYTGCVDAATGEVKLTRASAFPKHATRVKIANRVLRAVFAGHAAKIAECGWSVVANKLA